MIWNVILDCFVTWFLVVRGRNNLIYKMLYEYLIMLKKNDVFNNTLKSLSIIENDYDIEMLNKLQ